MKNIERDECSRNDRVPLARMMIAAAGFASLTLAIWIARGSDAAESLARTPTPLVPVQETGALAAHAEPSAGTRSDAQEESSASAPESTEGTESAASAQTPNEREAMLRQLKTAIEVSLTGGLDPGAILDACLGLVKLHVDRTDLPLAAPDGSLRYRLANTPTGMQAELWVTRSKNAKFENVLALRLSLEPPAEPYMLEGAVRKNPVAHVQAFLDKSGHVKDLVIMTDVAPSNRSRRWGLPLDEGRIPEGIIYHLEMDDPLGWTAETYGLVDGSDASWKDPIALLGEPWPQAPALAQFSAGLLNLLSEVRN
jgi:hypothetical protein